MPAMHDDNAATWRDLAEQLTPEQIEKLTVSETQSPLPDAEKADLLLDLAREWGQRNLDDHLMFCQIGRPAGATAVFHCGERTDGRGWSREFTGATRRVAGVSLTIEGTQFADGGIERQLYVVVDDLPDSVGGALNADGARQLAAALIEAANELDEAR